MTDNCYRIPEGQEEQIEVLITAVHEDVSTEFAEKLRQLVHAEATSNNLSRATCLATLSFVLANTCFRTRQFDELAGCELTFIYTNYMHATVHALYDDQRTDAINKTKS